MNKEKIGFIGLGVMGKPMSKNLLKAGYSLVVYDIRPEPVEELVKLGAERANSPKEVAEKCNIIITMLPDGPDVEQVILGPNGVLEGLRKGSIVIDMSSISPIVAKRVAMEVEKKGGEMLDAPVSGSEPSAIEGTLAIMVGGKEEVFKKCLPIFQAMGKTITLVGGSGAGQIAKLANQIIVALNIAALSEALVLATKAGLDPEVVFQAIRGGLAGSMVMERKAPMIMDRNFKPGFRIKLHQKDLRNVMQAATEYNVPLPFTSLAYQVLNALVNEGKGDLDHSAIVLFLEDLAKAEVKRKK
ncbi:MAG: 2-hydroxy-3-oxopropionate reductase [Nitrososphaerota archaeon]|nr:2-hydroxy-3-oxopropionate reductase [Nitrososphaerales archaeon]MDW8045031.1 2-hydroxy-3-oxopropionate reductase [Nitrososphaerota archaeon]